MRHLARVRKRGTNLTRTMGAPPKPRGGHLVVGDADALAFQLAWLAQRRIGAYVERVLAKNARRKDRNGDEARIALGAQDGVGGERHLGDVELLVVQHAPERFARPQREVREPLDAFDLPAAVD